MENILQRVFARFNKFNRQGLKMLIENFKRTYRVLDNKEKRLYIFISILTLLSNLLEIISIGSIPVFISFIFDPNLINKYFLFLDIDINFNANKSQNFALYSSFCCNIYFFNKKYFYRLFVLSQLKICTKY